MSPERPDETAKPESTPDPYDAHVTINRRTFFTLLALGATAGTAAITSHKIAHNEHIPDYSDMIARLKEKVTESKASVAYTVAESGLFTIGQTVLGDMFERGGIPTGGHAYSQEHSVEAAEKYEFLDFCKKNGLIPLIEEALFRLVPAAATADASMAWGMGMAANAVFAANHNLDKDERGDYMVFYKTVPALQFVLGAYCWYLQKTRGFSHAVAAHVTYNCLVGIIPTFFEKQSGVQ